MVLKFEVVLEHVVFYLDNIVFVKPANASVA